MELKKEKLGKLLVDEGLISQEELDMALEFQEKVGGRLGEILVKFDYVDEDELIELVADQQNLETVDLENMVLPEDLIREIPEELIEKHEVIPLEEDGDVLKLAIHDPFAFDSIEEIQLVTDYRIEPALATRESILKAINDLFYGEEEKEKTEDGSGESTEAIRKKLQDDSVSEEQILEGLLFLLVDKNVFTWEELNEKISQSKGS